VVVGAGRTIMSRWIRHTFLKQVKLEIHKNICTSSCSVHY